MRIFKLIRRTPTLAPFHLSLERAGSLPQVAGHSHGQLFETIAGIAEITWVPEATYIYLCYSATSAVSFAITAKDSTF